MNSTNITFNGVNGNEHFKAVQKRNGGESVDEKDEQADFEEGNDGMQRKRDEGVESLSEEEKVVERAVQNK